MSSGVLAEIIFTVVPLIINALFFASIETIPGKSP